MHRFRIAEHQGEYFLLRGEEREHLVRVLRLAAREVIAGFDNSGGEWLAEIERIETSEVVCRIIAEEYPSVEARTAVYLVTGLTKGEKMEWVVQKGTELGMAGLIPLRAKRSVMQLEGKRAAERVARWQKIAAEAVKQSRRVKEPRIEQVSDWAELGQLVSEAQWLIPYEEEKTSGLSQVLKELDASRPIAILIGPEGGFDSSEVKWAKEELGACPVSLGPRILRAETAAVATLTMILANYGDLG